MRGDDDAVFAYIDLLLILELIEVVKVIFHEPTILLPGGAVNCVNFRHAAKFSVRNHCRKTAR